ncbi:MAG: hypothetical protein KAR40_09625 [Candidatus Sabulitectum sp.]|nr:hypothetical protein [Candidatus Sabulitectum sp.]
MPVKKVARKGKFTREQLALARDPAKSTRKKKVKVTPKRVTTQFTPTKKALAKSEKAIQKHRLETTGVFKPTKAQKEAASKALAASKRKVAAKKKTVPKKNGVVKKVVKTVKKVAKTARAKAAKKTQRRLKSTVTRTRG